MTKRPTLTLNWRGKTTALPDVIFDDAPVAPIVERRKVERILAIGPAEQQTPLQLCLAHWCNWMHQNDRDLGAKSQVGIRGGGDHEGYDDSAAAGDEAACRAEREIAMATDAMIDSLPRHYKAAIYTSCSISTVWRFPNMNYLATLPAAQDELAGKLARNIATRAFF